MNNRQHIEKLMGMTSEERHQYLEALDMRTFDRLINYMYSGESDLRQKAREIFRGIYNTPKEEPKTGKRKSQAKPKKDNYDPVLPLPRQLRHY